MNFTLNNIFKDYKSEKTGIKYYGWRVFAIVLAYFVIGSILAVYADNFAKGYCFFLGQNICSNIPIIV